MRENLKIIIYTLCLQDLEDEKQNKTKRTKQPQSEHKQVIKTRAGLVKLKGKTTGKISGPKACLVHLSGA